VTTLGLYTGVPRDALAFLAADGKTPNTAFNRSNLPRVGLYDSASDTGNVALQSGKMTAVPVFLAAGEVVTSVSFVTGATAGATMTHWWAALYDSASTPNLLAQTADQTSGALAASTVITKALATAQTIGKTGVYWVAIMVAASTVPTLLGAVGAPPVVTGERNLAVVSGSSLAATATATLASPAANMFVPYVALT
jgi:hypothetical protein